MDPATQPWQKHMWVGRSVRQDSLSLSLSHNNVQAGALPQLDGYYYPPVTGVEGGRVMVATHVSTRPTYSPLVSPAGSVGCRLTTCAVSIPTKGSNRQTSLVNVYYIAGSSKIAEIAWSRPWDGQLGGGWRFQRQTQTVGCYCYSFEWFALGRRSLWL